MRIICWYMLCSGREGKRRKRRLNIDTLYNSPPAKTSVPGKGGKHRYSNLNGDKFATWKK